MFNLGLNNGHLTNSWEEKKELLNKRLNTLYAIPKTRTEKDLPGIGGYLKEPSQERKKVSSKTNETTSQKEIDYGIEEIEGITETELPKEEYFPEQAQVIREKIEETELKKDETIKGQTTNTYYPISSLSSRCLLPFNKSSVSNISYQWLGLKPSSTSNETTSPKELDYGIEEIEGITETKLSEKEYCAKRAQVIREEFKKMDPSEFDIVN